MRQNYGSVWVDSLDDKRKRIGLSKEGLLHVGAISWLGLPTEGDVIEQHAPLLLVESSKAAIEVESPFAGRVCAIRCCTQDLLQSLVTDPEKEWLVELVLFS